MTITELTQDNFAQETADPAVPVLVDFWASWCGPCRALSPLIDEIAEKYAGRVKVCKVNIDEQVPLALTNRVMAVPTLMAFRNGAAAGRLVGLVGEDEIVALLGLNEG